MTKSTVTTEVHQSLDVQSVLTPQITFHLVVGLKELTDSANFAFRQVARTNIEVDVRLAENLLRKRPTYSEDVGKTDDDALTRWQVNARNSCHSKLLLALTLFMARVLTNHPDDAFAADDPALIADSLNRRSNFHFVALGWPRRAQ